MLIIKSVSGGTFGQGEIFILPFILENLKKCLSALDRKAGILYNISMRFYKDQIFKKGSELMDNSGSGAIPRRGSARYLGVRIFAPPTAAE